MTVTSIEGRWYPVRFAAGLRICGLPTKEADIFDIKFTHTGYTFYVSVPDADGKIPALAILPPFDPSKCR
jgi:hypothetical protein